MIYADEPFYTSNYLCGREAVIQTAFSFYAMQATTEIRRYIGVNLPGDAEVPDAVKYCCCELAEILYHSEQTEQSSRGVASESVQGWSKSYESTDARNTVVQQAQKRCIYKWLGDSGLLYRGVGVC